MDAELSGSTLGKSFQVAEQSQEEEDAGDGGEDKASAEPSTALLDVDVPYNLVQHLMHSVQSQAGVAGPASTVMGALDLDIPHEWRVAEGEEQAQEAPPK